MSTAINACDWHRGHGESDGDSCCQCGCLLSQKQCGGCGKLFLNWAAQGGDDIVRSPRATSDGDLCCDRCVVDLEPSYDDDFDDGRYDDYFDQYD